MKGAILYMLRLIEQGKKEALEKQNVQDVRFFENIEREVRTVLPELGMKIEEIAEVNA